MPSELVTTITPTLTANSAYAAGNGIGGIQTLTVPPARMLLQNLVISDAAAQASALEILLFNAQPSGGTYSNKVALALAAADQAKLVGHLSVGSSDWKTVGGMSVVSVKPGAQVMAGLGNGGTLYMLIAVGGTSTPTWTGTAQLSLTAGFIQS